MIAIAPALVVAAGIAAAVSLCLAAVLSMAGPIDQPVGRSLHRTPTPRAGGLALIGGLAAGLISLWPLWPVADVYPYVWLMLALMLAGLMGFADDVLGLNALSKLVMQILLGVFLATNLVTSHLWLPMPWGDQLVSGLVMVILVSAWVVGSMNAVNFMDGANGMALMTACAIALALLMHGAGIWALWLLVCPLAILLLNASGRVFLGDVGSQPLGLLIAAMALPTINGHWAVAPVVMGLAPFIVDVGCTLVMRAWRREPLHQAHRQHLYQVLIDHGHPHLPVSACYAAFAWLGTLGALLADGASMGGIILFWYGLLAISWLVVRRRYVRRSAQA